MQGALFKLTKTSVKTIAPWVLVLATITAIISPVIMLWLRGIDKGFTVVITALLLLLDILLISPLFALHWGSPEKKYVESRRTRVVDKKSKKGLLFPLRWFKPETTYIDISGSQEVDQENKKTIVSLFPHR
jgi:hypothetical protein